MSQAERILFIDKKLRSPCQRVTASEVAEHFEVSSRQVKRDIEYLRDRMNAPIVYDASIRAYRYETEYKDLQFANQDIIVSYLALQSLAKNKQYLPLYQDSLLDAIDQQLPGDYKQVCSKITYQMPPADSIQPQYFEDFCTSMRDSIVLNMVYTNVKGMETNRLVEVHHLINYGGSWYLIAWEKEKNNFRTFNVSRISKLSLTSEKFQPHGEDFMRSLKSFINGGFGIFHGEETTSVKIRFYGEAARIVSTQTWQEQQIITRGVESNSQEKEVSYLQLEFPAADFTEVLYKILSFGSQARPVYPESLVELWKNEILKMKDLSKV